MKKQQARVITQCALSQLKIFKVSINPLGIKQLKDRNIDPILYLQTPTGCDLLGLSGGKNEVNYAKVLKKVCEYSEIAAYKNPQVATDLLSPLLKELVHTEYNSSLSAHAYYHGMRSTIVKSIISRTMTMTGRPDDFFLMRNFDELKNIIKAQSAKQWLHDSWSAYKKEERKIFPLFRHRVAFDQNPAISTQIVSLNLAATANIESQNGEDSLRFIYPSEKSLYDESAIKGGLLQLLIPKNFEHYLYVSGPLGRPVESLGTLFNSIKKECNTISDFISLYKEERLQGKNFSNPDAIDGSKFVASNRILDVQMRALMVPAVFGNSASGVKMHLYIVGDEDRMEDELKKIEAQSKKIEYSRDKKSG